MCKVKATRVDKNVPEWVQKEWRTGDKNALADLFVQTNFQKEPYPFHFIATSLMLSVFYLASLFFMLGQEDFLNRLQTIVRKRQSIKLTIDEGFYSESEMKEELGWGQQDPQVYFPSALPAPTIAQMHAHILSHTHTLSHSRGMGMFFFRVARYYPHHGPKEEDRWSESSVPSAWQRVLQDLCLLDAKPKQYQPWISFASVKF